MLLAILGFALLGGKRNDLPARKLSNAGALAHPARLENTSMPPSPNQPTLGAFFLFSLRNIEREKRKIVAGIDTRSTLYTLSTSPTIQIEKHVLSEETEML